MDTTNEAREGEVLPPSMTVDVHATAATTSLTRRAAEIHARSQEIAITNAEHYVEAGEQLKAIKGITKQLDDERKGMTRPLDEAKQRIMDFFNPSLRLLTAAEGNIKSVMLRFQKDEEERQRIEAAKAEETARKEREKLEERAAKHEAAGRTEKAEALKEVAASTVAAPVAPPQAVKVAGVATREIWKYEIQNAASVPRDYLMVDEKKIAGVVRAMKGDTKIPGIRVYAEKGLASTSK